MSNYQEKLSRLNKPRVHITYNVETEGAAKKIELPYVAGVITNLSGDTQLDNQKDLNFVNVDSDNLDSYLSEQKASLNYTVPNVITNTGNINVNLKFKTRDCFGIVPVINQIEELNVVYYKIQIISKIATMVSNNDKLSSIVTKLILNKRADNVVSTLKERLSSTSE